MVGVIAQSYLDEVFIGSRRGSRLIRGGTEGALRATACAGLAAVIFLLRLNVGSPTAGIGYEQTAIAAVILGGASLTGGRPPWASAGR